MSSEEKKQKIAATFSDVAARYDTNRFFALSAAKLVSYLDVGDTRRMLDLSTGTGAIALAAAQKNRKMEIEAVDISRAMLAQAEQKAKTLQIRNITFRHKDVENMGYTPSSFDLVTCGYAIFFYPDMTAALKSFFNTLKPGGQLAFSTFTADAFTPHSETFLALLKEYGVEAPELSRRRLHNKDEIRSLCSRAGTDEPEVITHTLRYAISTDEWWKLLNSAGYKALLDQIKAHEKEEFKERHMEEVKNAADEGMVELNADSLYTIINKGCL